MDQTIHAGTPHGSEREAGIRKPLYASNAGEIRHRRLLTTLDDLTEREITALTGAIQRNQIAGNLHELLTGTNAHG